VKRKSLQDCKSVAEVCRLERDNFSHGNFTIMSDGHTVWLTQQAMGQSPTKYFDMPKWKFDFLIRKYQAPQKEPHGPATGGQP
jgi:hypothetical protein